MGGYYLGNQRYRGALYFSLEIAMKLDHPAALEWAAKNKMLRQDTDKNLDACYLDIHARHERLRELAKAFLHEAHLNTRAEKALRAELEKPL